MEYREFKKRYNIHLNEQQESALTSVDGQTLLLAVPGSGKTTTLVCRVGYMIYVCGIDPSRILVLTFTRAAASDMKDRFVSIFGDTYANQLRFRTINGLCEYTISRYSSNRFLKRPKLVEDNYYILLKLYQNTYNTYPAETDIKSMQLAITRAKNLQMTEVEIRKTQVESKPLFPLYAAYDKYMKDNDLMDFDDQLVFTHDILSKDPGFLNHLQDMNPYILVDEAQDTSKIQHEIINLIASKHKHIFMVGDEDQSIYGFRAAYPDALLQFSKVYPESAVLKLERNYRSTPEIVNIANHFIAQNRNRYSKKMFTNRPSGNKVRLLSCSKREDQYRSITRKLLPQLNGVTAVIYRNNESAIPLIAEMMRADMGFRCKGMDPVFFNSRIVIEVKKILESAFNPYNYKLFWDTFSLFEAHISRKAAYTATNSPNLRRYESIWHAMCYVDEVSRKYKENIKTIAAEMSAIRKNNNARDAIQRICNMGYKRANDDRLFILKTLTEENETVQAFLSRLSDFEYSMSRIANDKRSPYILTTVHSSKGLEYDNVIIMDEIVPVFPDNRVDIEEERRLFYVAMTRAKNNLILLSYGNEVQPFIDSIKKPAPQSVPPTPPPGLALYKVGARVYHKQFGKGIIKDIDGDIATVRFDIGQTRKFGITICAANSIFKFL